MLKAALITMKHIDSNQSIPVRGGCESSIGYMKHTDSNQSIPVRGGCKSTIEEHEEHCICTNTENFKHEAIAL